jgi:hypothetical protein
VTKPLLLWTGRFTLKLESLVRIPYGRKRPCGVFHLRGVRQRCQGWCILASTMNILVIAYFIGRRSHEEE